MARLSDLPHVMRTVGPIGFIRRVIHETMDDYVFTWAASLAYSWMFAVFPFLIFLLALLPYLPDPAKQDATDRLKELIAQAMPAQAAEPLTQLYDGLPATQPDRGEGPSTAPATTDPGQGAVGAAVAPLSANTAGQTLQRELENLVERPRTALLSLGILIALYGASNGIAATMVALDRAYDVEIPRGYVRTRLVAALLTLAVTSLILLLLCLMPVATSMLRWADNNDLIPDWARWLFNGIRYTAALVLMFTILSLMYHFGPSVRGRWRWITPGSIFVVVCWILLGLALRWYIDRFGAASYARTYGAIGGVAIMLLVFYADAIVLLIGAEINSEIDFAVLGVTTTADLTRKTPPRADLRKDELKLLEQLQRRRPSLTIHNHPPARPGLVPDPLLHHDESPSASASESTTPDPPDQPRG